MDLDNPLDQILEGQDNPATTANELIDSVSPAALYGRRAETSNLLTWGYYGGRADSVLIPHGTVVLTASDTNYIVANKATGAVSVSTTITNWDDGTNYTRLYLVVTDGTGPDPGTPWEDHRQVLGAPSVGLGFTGGTLTSAVNEAPAVTLASAATVNIGAAASNTINISGTVTITAFDTIADGARRLLHFQAALTFTHNGTSLILPTGANITTAAGDTAEALSLGSGNWRVTSYQRKDGTALSGSSFTGGTLTSALNEAPIVTIASAGTVNIGAAAANSISISGVTTITAFDTIADGALRRLVFQGVLILTHHGTSLILPTAANITTAAGDAAVFLSLGSGNWRCVGYERASGQALVTTVTESFCIAASDETTALTAGTAKVTFRMPYAFTVTAVRASLTVAQTGNGGGGIFTVDIHESATTILSTKITIDNGELTSVTGTPPVISDSSLADDAEMKIDIDQIGDGTAKGLKVYIIGNRT